MSDLVRDARTWSPDAQEAVRLLAVSALVEGRGRVEAADLFKVSVRAVDNWWARWQAGRRDALLSRPRARRAGEHQVLSEAGQPPCVRLSSITPHPAWGFPVNCGRGGRQAG
ncbi:helix-turn-helix domain-containing protein [Streptomyces sp. 8L]|uniref:helix-turn-helix domain-containing protein n=1 Tax=Streptomyces sp. 8L TaxID=2877242 RepID=UPI003F9320A1